MFEAASHLSAGFLSRLHVVNRTKLWDRHEARAEQNSSICLLIPPFLSTSDCVGEFPPCGCLAPKEQLPTHAGQQSACWLSGRSIALDATPCHFSTGLVTRDILP